MSAVSREQRLEIVLQGYLQAIDRGAKPDRQAILDANPDLRDELAEYFNDASKLDAMAKSLKTASLDGDGVASPRLRKVAYFGDYELLEEVARGGMGVVYKAKQVSLNRVVALKMILKGELASEADVRRFRQEAEAAANLDHPNIVPIYEVGEHEGQQYFSMKLIETAPAGKLTPREAAQRLAKVAWAVHHAHQRGILHRDLKPSNILIDRDGEPHVADFGLAKKVDGGDDATKSGAIVGTPAYMAPEQARAEKSLTTAVDVYSLGAILYEWLTGRPPFQGEDVLSTLMKVVNDEPQSLRTINARIDRDLETICLKCLEKESQRRYASAAALADELDCWLRSEPITARPIGALERSLKWLKRRPAIAALLAAVTLVSLLGILLVFWQWLRAENANTKLRATAQAESEARKEADARRLEAEAAQKQEQRQSARLALERGLTLLEQGSMNHGLLWIGKSMTLVPKEDADFRRVAWLNLAAWYPSMHTAQWRQNLPTECLQFLSDPTLLVLGGGDGHARCWDTIRNHQVWMSPKLGTALKALALSADGKKLAVGVEDKIVLLNPRDGQPTGVSLNTGETVLALALHPDGTEVLVGGAKQARRWDLASSKALGAPLPTPRPVTSAAYSPDGSQCVTSCLLAREDRHHDRSEHIQRWDRTTGKKVGVEIEHPLGLAALRWFPDGQTPHWAPHLERRVLQVVGTAGLNVDVSPDGRYLAARSGDYHVYFWDLFNRQKPVGQPIYQQGWTERDWARFRPDGLATLSGMRGNLQIWDFAGVRRPKESPIEGFATLDFARFSPSGKSMVAGGNGEVRLFDVATGAPIGERSKHEFGSHQSTPVLGNDERTLILGSKNGTVEVRDAKTGKDLFSSNSHASGIFTVALSRDGSVALSACMKGVARCRNLKTGQQIGPDFNVGSEPHGAALSHDGTIAFCGPSNGFFLRAWDVASGKIVGTAPTGGAVGRTVVSPDGKWIAVHSWGDSRVRLGTVTPLGFSGLSLEHAPGPVLLAFSPDSQLLLTGSNDELRLFDVATGLRIGPILSCKRTIVGQSFSSEGDTVLAATSDGVLYRFSVPAMVADPQGTLVKRALFWTQLLTGMELDIHGQGNPQSDAVLKRLRTELDKLDGPPANLTPTPDQIRVWHRQEANDHLAARRWLAAHWHLNRLLVLDPKDQTARTDRAITLLGMELPKLAQADLNQLPNKGLNDPRLVETIGHLAQRNRRWAEAAVAYGRAAELDQGNPTLIRCQAACLVLAQDAVAVKKALSKMTERSKGLNLEGNLRLFQALALIYDLNDGWDARFNLTLNAWSDLWPDHVVGLVSYRAGKLDRARQAVEKSLGFYAASPSHVNNWLLMAAIEHRSGNEVESRRWFVKATSWIDRVVAEQPNTALTPGNLEIADWLECLVLRNDMERLLASKKP